jgi:hypothetical protein
MVQFGAFTAGSSAAVSVFTRLSLDLQLCSDYHLRTDFRCLFGIGWKRYLPMLKEAHDGGLELPAVFDGLAGALYDKLRSVLDVFRRTYEVSSEFSIQSVEHLHAFCDAGRSDAPVPPPARGTVGLFEAAVGLFDTSAKSSFRRFLSRLTSLNDKPLGEVSAKEYRDLYKKPTSFAAMKVCVHVLCPMLVCAICFVCLCRVCSPIRLMDCVRLGAGFCSRSRSPCGC